MANAPLLLNAFLLTVVLVIAFKDIAARTGLLDLPDDRKRHEGHVPLVGGLAMFPAYAIASIFLDRELQAPFGVMAGLALLVAIGALDDRFGLRVVTRLTAQAAAALLMAWPIAGSIDWLGGVVGLPPTVAGMIALPLAVVFIVGMANALNMMDGLDGLAGGVAAIALLWLALVAMSLGRDDAIAPALPLLFAVLGFLVFNLRHRFRARASVFMGDAGSLMLGGAIAYFALSLASGGGARVTSVAPLLWIVALPAIETLSLIVRRLRAGRNPMAGDRRHMHHLLVDAGLPPARAAAALIIASGLLGAVGYGASRLGVPDPVLFAGLVLAAAAHCAVVIKAPSFIRLRLGRPAAETVMPSPSTRIEV